MSVRVFLAATLLFPSMALAGNWADEADYPDLAESKEICRQFKSVAIPDPNRPDRRAEGGMPGCDAEALYYGIGVPPAPDKAFACAKLWAGEGYMDSDVILLTIYANGKGAKRDLDTAIAMACTMGFAPMESHYRVKHLFALRQEPNNAEEFHWCDDITSGLSMGVCANHAQRITEAERQTRWAPIKARWSQGEAAAALARLMESGNLFARHHGGEIDQSGTARGAFITLAEENVANGMIKDLEDLAADKATLSMAVADDKADAELNRVYRRVMAYDFGDIGGAPSHANIRSAQRAWLKYRDAWVVFVKIAVPDMPTQAIVNHQTRRRIEHLKELIGEEK